MFAILAFFVHPDWGMCGVFFVFLLICKPNRAIQVADSM
jgi:hypothetical protein